jgi:RNA polymerase sigma factor (sigma-70 family)
MTDRLDGAPVPLTEVTRVVRLVARRDRLSDDEADDLRSLTFLKLLQDTRVLRRFQRRSTMATYLAVVVRRLLVDQRRRQFGRRRPSGAPMRVFVAESAAGGLPDPHACADVRVTRRHRRSQAAAARGALQAALAAMPRTDRALLAWRFRDGRSIKEIAAALRVPPQPLYRRFDALLRALRRDVERRGAADAARDIVRERWDEENAPPLFDAPRFAGPAGAGRYNPRHADSHGMRAPADGAAGGGTAGEPAVHDR